MIVDALIKFINSMRGVNNGHEPKKPWEPLAVSPEEPADPPVNMVTYPKKTPPRLSKTFAKYWAIPL